MNKKILILIVALLVAVVAVACNPTQPTASTAPTFEQLIESNGIDKLFESYSTITINHSTTYGTETVVGTQFFHKENGVIVLDSAEQSGDSVTLVSERGQASYSSFDGILEVAVVNAPSAVAGYFDTFTNISPIGQISEEDGCWVASFWNENDASFQFTKGVYCTVWFDKTSLRATKAVAKVFSKDLVKVSESTSTFSYNNDSCAFESAFNLHTSGQNPLAIELVINPGLDTENVVNLTTDKSATLFVEDADFTTLSLYKAVDDIHEINSLADVDGSAVTLFAISGKPAVSFECNFTEEHVTAFETLIAEFVQAGLDGDKGAFDTLLDEVNFSLDFIESQHTCHTIAYYCNPADDVASTAFAFIDAERNNWYSLYSDALKTLAQSSPIKDYIFAGYTEEELDDIAGYNSDVLALENQVSALVLEYQALDQYSATWAEDADEIALEMAKLNHQIALLNGYDNYYEYASETIYNRNYTKDERASFRQYVKEYILPAFSKSYQYYGYYENKMSSEEFVDFFTFRYGLFGDDEEVQDAVFGYIDTYFGTSMYDKMMSAFYDNAAVFAENRNSLGTAFASYDYIYEHSVMYFSYYAQDPFSVCHELGHYASFYHYDLKNMSYDVAELHSQSNEWMFAYYLQNVYGPNAWNTILMNTFVGSFETVINSTVVDHFEEALYTALENNSDMTMEEYSALLVEITEGYTYEKGASIKASSHQNYIRLVVVESPVYYLSYATSQLASMSYAAFVSENDFEYAQQKFADLLENVDPDLTFAELVEEVGLLNPFEEETYVRIEKLIERNSVEFDLARKDLLFAESNEIENLFEIDTDNTLVNFDEDGRVLMIFFTNNEGELYYTTYYGTEWGNLPVVSADEMVDWYESNKDNVTDWQTRLEKLLGYIGESEYFGFVGMWVDTKDLYRLAYQTDITLQVSSSDLVSDAEGNYTSIDDAVEDDILSLRENNITASHKLYTLLGFTHDFAENGAYGLSEFIVPMGASVEVAFSYENTEQFVQWLESQSAQA